MMRGGAIFCVFAVLTLSTRLLGQEIAPASKPAKPGSDLRIFVITFGPGDEVWEKFGHNAIRVYDPAAPDGQQDLVYNWGVFNPVNIWSFAYRFLQGRLIYSMESDPTRPVLEYYASKLNRRIDQQELNLTAAQKTSLRDVLVRTDTDANRYYLYDYYRNNCTTRVRDVIDDQIGHRLSAATRGVPSGTTYRWHTDRLDADAPWLYVALQAALGQPVDVPIDRWQEMFLPLQLHNRLAETTVIAHGRELPLVIPDEASRNLYASTRPGEPAAPPHWGKWFLLSGALLGLTIAGLGHTARRHWTARLGFSLVAVPWLLLMGIGGAIVVWAWIGTDHVVCRRNENVLQISILALPLIVLLPMRAWGARRGVALTVRLAFIMAGLSVIGLLLKALPMFYQANWNILALCVPVNLALAYAARTMAVAAPRTAKEQIPGSVEASPGATPPGTAPPGTIAKDASNKPA